MKNIYKIITLSFLTLSSGVFAAGTFECLGQGVVIKGSYGSTFGASLSQISIEGVGEVKGEEIVDASVYLTDKQLLAQTAIGSDHLHLISLETVGAPQENGSEPWVYGGIVQISSNRLVDDEVISNTKAIPVTCSASF